jgi:sporulation protein YlmC with PRC-barrel domain
VAFRNLFIKTATKYQEGVVMRPSELQGKNVVGTGAKILGTVSDVEFDPTEWKITNVQVELSDDAVETLGFKKPHFGHVDILLSVEAVKAVADVVNLKNAITELKEFIKPPK